MCVSVSFSPLAAIGVFVCVSDEEKYCFLYS